MKARACDMNIGIIDEFREKYITGINRVVCGTLTELQRQSNFNYCFLGKTDYLPIKLPEVGLFFDKEKEINLNYTLMSHKIDVVHSFYRAYDFSDRIECGRVLTIHDLMVMLQKEHSSKALCDYFEEPLRRCAQKADVIIADSQYTKKDIVQHYNILPEKIKVIYPGLYPQNDFEKIISVDSVKDLAGKQYIFSVSAMSAYKNQVGLIKAFRIYKQRHVDSDLKLVLTGPPRLHMEGIWEEIRKVPDYETEIVFTGFVSDEELIWLYRNCLAHAQVSKFEGFGLTVLEALSQGKTAICSNVTSLPEVGGDAVEYCDPYDIESIVTSIENVVLNETRRKELESRALGQAAKFSYEKAASQTLEIYKKFE